MATHYGTQQEQQRGVDEEAPLVPREGDSPSEGCCQRIKSALCTHKHRILSTWLIIMAVTAVLTLSFHFSLRRPHSPVDADKVECISDRSWFVTLMLSIFLGEFGVDRLYLGYVFLGILKLITAGLGGIWWLVDIILISVDVLTDHDGCRLR